jgi:hypothetical protein
MKERTINPDLIPILTETADGTVLDLPTLTETVSKDPAASKAATAQLTDEQCRKLAERLFPQLEVTLRASIGTRSEARWEKAMQQVQAELPALIRSSVPKRR